jgi:AcrR family transcriptional regulator
MSKVLQNKLQKQKALLDSAYELFTTIGFTKTTIRDIAHKAGVAKGTFYLYFNDKVEIRDALVRAKSSQLLQDACEAMDRELSDGSATMDTADKFIFIINYLVDYVSKDLNFLKFMSKHLSWGLFAGSHHTVQYHSDEDNAPVIDFVAYVGKMLEADNVKIREPRFLIFTLLELVSSTCYDVILYSEPMPLDEFKPHLNRTIRLLVNDAIV